MVFQMLLCDECYENIYAWRRWRCLTMDSLYAFKCKRFRNTRYTVTLEYNFKVFLNTL
jgi:hypothetical protein